MPTVTIFGSNAVNVNDAGYQEAYELGQLLGRAGYTIATGGYGGTMEAASHGAHEAGAHVIGVTTGRFDGRGLTPNPWVDEEIKFPTLFRRLHYLVTCSDALVALRGGVGTLSEVALTWSLLQVGEMPCKPFVLVGPQWRHIMETIYRESTAREHDRALIRLAATASQVTPLLKAWEATR